MITEEQIQALAYSIWEQEGRPEGKHEEHYFRAKQILEERAATSGVSIKTPPSVINLPPQRKGKKPARGKKA